MKILGTDAIHSVLTCTTSASYHHNITGRVSIFQISYIFLGDKFHTSKIWNIWMEKFSESTIKSVDYLEDRGHCSCKIYSQIFFFFFSELWAAQTKYISPLLRWEFGMSYRVSFIKTMAQKIKTVCVVQFHKRQVWKLLCFFVTLLCSPF